MLIKMNDINECLQIGNIEERLKSIEESICLIQARNERVEGDKAWETSFFRVALVTVLTYCVIAFVFLAIGVEQYLVNACIPAIGYFLSTQSLPFVKSWWLARRGGK